MISFFLPRRRPMDNVEWTVASPQEDEFALCVMTLCSPCMSWIFPRRREKFRKYLTFRDVAPNEIEEWKVALGTFLRKLQFRDKRPLILKSPPHTARIPLLLEMFPRAKFVHIHRDPVTVFQSSVRTLETMLDWQALQRADPKYFDEWILQQYREMYDAFFEARPKVPAGQFCEVAFEHLEQNPIEQIGRIYETLGLPSFASFEPVLQRYVKSLAGYKKNTFPELSPERKARLKSSWARCSEEWGYSSTK